MLRSTVSQRVGHDLVSEQQGFVSMYQTPGQESSSYLHVQFSKLVRQ